VNEEIEIIWKEGVAAYFKTLSQHYMEELKKYTKRLQSLYIRPQGRDLNPAHPEYEAESLTT
jgi:hypothetical protein